MTLRQKILFGIGLCILFISLKYCDTILGECYTQRLVNRMEFQGTVDSTYIDRSNNSYETISYHNDTRDYVIPRGDISGFFHNVKKGDRLMKTTKSNIVQVIRDKDTILYSIDYDCD